MEILLPSVVACGKMQDKGLDLKRITIFLEDFFSVFSRMTFVPMQNIILSASLLIAWCSCVSLCSSIEIKQKYNTSVNSYSKLHIDVHTGIF